MRHKWSFQVPSEVIDVHGHVNNVAYVQWMQDAAIRHTESIQGHLVAAEAGIIWVARKHEIEYLRPLFEGDNIRIETWIDSSSRVTSDRQYAFIREADKVEVAGGRTTWVCLDAATGRPRAIPEEVIAVYMGSPE